MAKSLPPSATPDVPFSTSRTAWAGLVADLRAIGHDADVDLALRADMSRARDRLSQVTAQLGVDGTTVTGSRGQVRAHPLLGAKAALRREVAAGFDRLGCAAVMDDFTFALHGCSRRTPYPELDVRTACRVAGLALGALDEQC